VFSRYVDFIDRYPHAGFVWSASQGFVHANPLARSRFSHSMESAALATAAELCARMQRVHADEGSDRSFLLVPLIEATNRAECVIGLQHYDIADVPSLLHELDAHARHFAQIIHRFPGTVLTARPDGRFDYASHRWGQLVGDPLAATNVHASLHAACPRGATEFEQRWHAGVRTKQAFSFELPLRTVRGERWHDFRVEPWIENDSVRKWIVAIEDIDDDVAARERIAACQRRTELLAEVGAVALQTGVAEEELIRQVLAAAGRVISKIWIARVEIDAQYVVTAQPNEARLYERWFDPDQPVRSFERFGCEASRPVLRVPLCCGERGAEQILVIGEPGESAFSDDDMNLVRDVAYRLSTALRSARDLKRESRIARVLQTAMLPPALPRLAGVSLDVTYRPAESEALVGFRVVRRARRAFHRRRRRTRAQRRGDHGARARRGSLHRLTRRVSRRRTACNQRRGLHRRRRTRYSLSRLSRSVYARARICQRRALPADARRRGGRGSFVSNG
jgi:PAS domain-containing protein